MLPLCSLLFVSGSLAAKADGTARTAATQPDDAHKFLRVSLMQKTCRTPLDLKAESLTVEEVVGRVKKALLARKPSVVARIEVRDVLPVRLSIAVKGSTIGRVLGSTAALAGASLWIFSDHTLIAPEKALSTEERNEIQNGFGSAWATAGSSEQEQALRQKRKALSAFVGKEISAIVANGGGVPFKKPVMGITPTKTAINVTVGQLSPDAQAMLQELLVGVSDSVRNPPGGNGSSHMTLTAETTAHFDARFGDKGTLALNFPRQGDSVMWNLGGHLMMIGMGAGFPQTTPVAPTGSAPLPLDLSAGKS